MYIDRLGLLFLGIDEGFMKLWDIESYQCIKIIKAHDYGISCFLLLPSGYLVTGFVIKKFAII
jgi:hypothetical protein